MIDVALAGALWDALGRAVWAPPGIAWAVFIPACFALNLAPGPSNLTAFVNGARLPLRDAGLASLGRLPAFALLILVTAIGLGAALAASATAFWVIKILGAAYLIYLGVRMLRARSNGVAAARAPDGAAAAMARRDFWIALSNPKAIAIFTAFFPQFVDLAHPIAPQILTLGAVFLALEMLAALVYVGAGRVLGAAAARAGLFGAIEKGVGAFLVASGLSLAAATR